MIAVYSARFLRKMIGKLSSGRLPVDLGNSIRRLPWILRLFIVAQGLLIALDRVHLPSAFVYPVRTVLPIFSDILLLLVVITTVKIGFEVWAVRFLQIKDNTKHIPDGVEGQGDGKIKKARTLLKLLWLPLAVIIFLPDLVYDLPKDLVLLAAAIFILFDGLLIGGIVLSAKKSSPDAKTKRYSDLSLAPEIIETIEEKDPDFQIVVSIATLFLEILKKHLDASEDSPCRVKLVKIEADTAKYLFELEIHLYGNWKKRRMTIARLGADSGSRSKCFYVIYDEYLVVKVPPVAITDPLEYINSIKIEAAIARQLGMEECIIPIVSVILKHLEPSIDAVENALDSPEVLAMQALRRRPDLYRYLKVSGTFAYFMDMSKYFFLQDAVKMLHNTQGLSEGQLFVRTKAPIEGIVANLLDLLALIGHKGVALRDLKPDNLLLAGDRNDYPAFLSRPEHYKIGLIDIETAVVLGNPYRKQIDQPQLGGTPQYATPCHFFNNQLLKDLYGEVAEILHLQDWHGMIGVIFKVIDNRFLFEHTARLIPGIAHKINDSNNGDDISAFAIESSRLFWSTAEREFKEKMTAKREVLEKLKIPIAKPSLIMLKKRLLAEKQDLTAAIKKIVANQNLYSTEKSRIQLMKASSQELAKLSLQWENLPESRTELLKQQSPAVQLLQNLKGMKEQFESRIQVLKLLDDPAPKISAHLLLGTMFAVVSRRMFPDQWQELPVQKLQGMTDLADHCASASDLEKTCLEFQTIINDQTMKV